MNLFAASEFKVGLLVLVVSVLVAYMSMQVSDDPSYLGRSRDAWFLIDDASGLVKNSAVKMAGINVGIITDIKLTRGVARVEMRLRRDVELTQSARIEIRANGILGDKHIEVVAGDLSDSPLRDGGQILTVEDKGSVDALITEVSRIAKSLGGVAETLKSAVTEGDRSHALGRIVSNIEKLTADLSEMTGKNKEEINEIVQQVHSVTRTLSDLVNDETDEGFKASWRKAVASLSRIDKTLQNVEEITDKVNRGEGTIGRLINDEETVEELNTAIEGVNSFLDTASKLQTSIDFSSEYFTAQSLSKSSIGLLLQPGLDRYYEVKIVDDPKGVEETVETSTTTGGSTVESKETKKFRSKVKFTLLFAKNFYNFTVKGGLIENTGGVGFDYHFFRKRFRLSFEALNFGKLNLRTFGRYNFYKGVYVMGGVEDALNKDNSFSAFLGAGVFLTNDDLKLLVSKMPF